MAEAVIDPLKVIEIAHQETASRYLLRMAVLVLQHVFISQPVSNTRETVPVTFHLKRFCLKDFIRHILHHAADGMDCRLTCYLNPPGSFRGIHLYHTGSSVPV